MRIQFLTAVLLGACLAAQQPAEQEEQDLNRSLSEAGGSTVEFTRAIESHLAKYPNSVKKEELERALAKAAVERDDERRILLYGERVLERQMDDPPLLERVARGLLSAGDEDDAKRALKYARRFEQLIEGLRKEKPIGRMSQGRWQEELNRAAASALVLQARATGRLGQTEAAKTLAERSYKLSPSSDAAREQARWLEKAGKLESSIQHLADAFTITDSGNTELQRAEDRARMGELYKKLHGSEKGLGDIVLNAYDRTARLTAERAAKLRQADPNAEATRILDFTLSGLKGERLALGTLKGKTIVFDFWATWCGPCRVQHPLYEQVKQRFKDRPEVVFLSVNTDEDRSRVGPFLTAHQWSQAVHFEDGLTKAFSINSIPTTMIVDRNGEIVSRMNGFLPERFVDMLAERIEEALRP